MSNRFFIIRKLQTYFSIFLFLLVFSICWYTTGFNLTNIELSKWGEYGRSTTKIWNISLLTLSVSIATNAIYYLNNKRFKYKIFLKSLFLFNSICLLGLSLFTMDYIDIHNICAYLYFFTYPLNIFLFTYLNRKVISYNNWLFGTLLSVIMMILPLILTNIFNGMAIAEIVHTIFAIIWNIVIINYTLAKD